MPGSNVFSSSPFAWGVYEVHDCSALHVCSFILSILHQASFFFRSCDFRRITAANLTSLDKKIRSAWQLADCGSKNTFQNVSPASVLVSQPLPLQGIFSVSAFIVSVIYLSRQKQTSNLLDISPINLGKSATTPRMSLFQALELQLKGCFHWIRCHSK